MLSKLSAWFLKSTTGINWLRVGVWVFSGLFLIFIVRYVWILRPEEFYNNGLTSGTSVQKLECEQKEKAKNDEIFKRTQSEAKRRAKILSNPDIAPNDALLLMRLGDL